MSILGPRRHKITQHVCPKCDAILTSEQESATRASIVRQPLAFPCNKCTAKMIESPREREQTSADLGFLAQCGFSDERGHKCSSACAFGFEDVIAALSDPDNARCAIHTDVGAAS